MYNYKAETYKHFTNDTKQKFYKIKNKMLAIIQARTNSNRFPKKVSPTGCNLYSHLIGSGYSGRPRQIKNIKDKSGAPADVSRVGKTPDPEAVNILKSAPSAQNRKYFDDVYGAGAAAKVLGG